jgi:hypothetical protein
MTEAQKTFLVAFVKSDLGMETLEAVLQPRREQYLSAARGFVKIGNLHQAGRMEALCEELENLPGAMRDMAEAIERGELL